MEVASPEGWSSNPALVLDFYNQRRKQLDEVQPNAAHLALKALEEHFEVTIVTQNVDDLHERAGSNNILHLHGELRFARSSRDASQRFYLGGSSIEVGDTCSLGSQLRPDIVWFGEDVPLIERAAELVLQADILLIIGTSLEVYPAAGLKEFYQGDHPIYVVDLNRHSDLNSKKYQIINDRASLAVPQLTELLIQNLA
jgi:NAD-dependent deacetylase